MRTLSHFRLVVLTDAAWIVDGQCHGHHGTGDDVEQYTSLSNVQQYVPNRSGSGLLLPVSQ
jgi:hypothetical protein